MSTSKPIPQQRRPAPSESAGEFSSTLGRALFQQKIQKLLQGAIDSTGADGIAVSLVQGSAYVCQASVGLAPEVGVPVKPGEGVCGRCLSERATVVQDGIHGEIRSVAAVPIISNGKLQGLVAGFSLSESPFSANAIAKLQRVADTVMEEIEPSLVVELNPENEDILEQLGFQPAELSAATEDDSNYLPEIVLEVLKETPSNAPGASEAETNEVLSELMGTRQEHLPAETMREVEKEAREIVDLETKQPPTPELAATKTEPEKQPAPEPPPDIPAVPAIETPKAEKPFFHNTDPKRARTTEDVLMDLVQQSLHVSAVPAAVTKAEPSGEADVQGVVAAAPSAATAATPAVIEVPAEIKANTTAEEALQHAPESIREDSERHFPARVLTIGLAAALVVAIGVFLVFYLRKPPAPAAQPSAAVQSAATPPASPISSVLEASQANQSKDSSPASRQEEKTKPVTARSPQQQEPMMVAANGAPRRPAGTAADADPTPLTGLAVTPSSIDLPSPSTNVVFGGRRSSGVIPAKLLRRVEPTYPAMARTMHLSGDVQMNITVAEDGHVKNVGSVNGTPLLAASAVEAVKKWKYAPARQDGRAVESIVEITIRFR